jgi:hypothetical protein
MLFRRIAPACEMGALLALGFGIGRVCLGVGSAAPPAATSESRPNVVVLASEKRISYRNAKVDIKQLAEDVAKTTGTRIAVDAKLTDPQASFAVFLTDVPFARWREAMAYTVGGTWARTSWGWLLRPSTPTEAARDVAALEADLARFEELIKGLDPKDPSLTDLQRDDLAVLSAARSSRQPWPLNRPDLWRVEIRTTGLTLSYAGLTDGSAPAAGTNSMGWTWFPMRHQN